MKAVAGGATSGTREGARIAPAARALLACSAGLLALATAPARASEPPDAVTLDRLQVTASRSARDRHDTAAAVSVVRGAALAADGSGATLSEHLVAVPGVLARPRQNFAQDEQIAIRGFGTRASFGLRSVRVYLDGIPATMPDGQSQVSHLPLALVERIEVLRGPFSALYGNAAGGVIQVFTADGADADRFGLEAAAGSFGQRRIALDARGDAGRARYRVGAQRVHTDGWREHGRATRTLLAGTLRVPVGAGELTLLAHGFWSPDAQDPQGLTRGQVAADPRQASAGALRFDTRKAARQAQLGALLEQPVGDAATLRVLAYGGERRIAQVLSTPVEAQANPLHAGGWIELEAPFAGFDVRWIRTATVAGGALEWIAGLDAQAQRQRRRGYENFAGGRLGVRGALRLRQHDHVTSLDPYLQAGWQLAPQWRLSAGVRHSRVRFVSRDRFVTARNPDDSGEVVHRATLPVAGLTWQPRPDLSLYAAWGRGFETPTFNELAYRPDGGSGPHFALRPMRTRSAELGLRLDRTRGLQAELALFRTDTTGELVVNSSSGGRTTFQNAGRTRRSGLEGALRLPLGERWQLQLAATWLRAGFREPFPACRGPACTDTAVVPAGTRLPGVPRSQAHAGLRYGPATGFYAQLEARRVGAVGVTTRGDARAGRHTLVDAGVGWRFADARGEGRVFLAVDNVFDRAHVGAVIVNEANRRYYEPGAGRSVMAGLAWRWR